MQTLFENILTASLYGSIIIATILLLRPLMKRVPRKYLCLLWLLAFLRLVMPFEINSSLSLQPRLDTVKQPQSIPVTLPDPVPAVPEDAVLPEDVEIVYSDAFTPSESIPEGLEGYYPAPQEEEGPTVINWNAIALWCWAGAAMGLILYSTFSFLRLKIRVREAIRTQDGTWECAGLDTAFILGWVRPRVYLPTGLSSDTRHHILRHEKTHLKRLDHWMKLLGFLALSIHWFNPLVWAAWVLLCRDMELACDEQVVKDMGLEERKDYSAALLRCSTQKEHYLVCPVAFGEVSVKTRILSVLNYRKPRFWISLVGICAIVFVAVFLLTSPKEQEPLRAGYLGPNEPYEYYHATEREQKWEEDILYLAEMMLGKHPRLYDGDVTIYHGLEYNSTEFSNAMFDAEIQQAFIDGIDTLIPRLAQLSDEQIPFEINRVMALTGDDSSFLHLGWPVIQLPICVEPIWNGENVSYHLVGLPDAYENLMFGELTAINGISIADIAERLEPYIAYRNEQWAIRCLTGVDYCAHLQTRGALETAGVVETNAESAELTIQTDTGTYSVTLPFQKSEKWVQPGYVFEHLYATDLPPYRYIERKHVWSETLEDAVYLQIVHMPVGTNEVDQELVKVIHALQNAEKPMKLIIDLRIGAGGNSVRDRFKSFAGRVNGMETDGVYILIDSLSAIHAPTTAFLLKQWIEGAVLVGTPTGQSVNSFTYSENYSLPNNSLSFYVTEKYDYLDESLGDAVLQPDILVQQTLEDYKNGVDTVFSYVMNIGNEDILSEQTDPILRCREALDAIMNAESYHIQVSQDYTGASIFMPAISEIEYWKVGSNRMSRFYPDSDTCTSWRLKWLDQEYSRLDCATWFEEPHNWTETEFSQDDNAMLLPWFHFVDWEKDTITLESHITSGDSEVITLHQRTRDDSLDLLFVMTFHFDKDGTLTDVDRTLAECNGVACKGIVTTTFVSFDSESVYGNMLRNAQAPDILETAEDIQVYSPTEEERELLLRCYSALMWHQVQDWRHYQHHVTYSGDVPVGSDLTAEYWHSPITNLRRISMADRNDGWLAEETGTVYCKGIAPYYPEDVTSYTLWVEAVDPEETVMTTWLEEYQWNFSRITFLGTDRAMSGTVISFRVEETLTDNLGGTAPYHDVSFCLDEDDHLRWVTDKYTIQGTDNGKAYSVTVFAETLITTYDRNLVEEGIAKALEQQQYPY